MRGLSGKDQTWCVCVFVRVRRRVRYSVHTGTCDIVCVGVHAVQSMYAACGTKKKRRMKATLYVTFEYAIENCGERVEPIGAPGSASNEMSTCAYISGRTWGQFRQRVDERECV